MIKFYPTNLSTTQVHSGLTLFRHTMKHYGALNTNLIIIAMNLLKYLLISQIFTINQKLKVFTLLALIDFLVISLLYKFLFPYFLKNSTLIYTKYVLRSDLANI